MKFMSIAVALVASIAIPSAPYASAFQPLSSAPCTITQTHPLYSAVAMPGTMVDVVNVSVVDSFPRPLKGLQRTARAMEFHKHVLPVLAAYKTKEIVLEFQRKYSMADPITELEEQQMWEELDEWGSQQIADAIGEMRGFYGGDNLHEPISFEMVEEMVRQELLDDAPLSGVFATFAGERILDSLTSALGRMIFDQGIAHDVHGDPHHGNIDFGQFKALTTEQRQQLAYIVLAVVEYRDGTSETTQALAKNKLANLVRSFGVKLMEGDEDNDDLACAVVLFLFGDTDVELPGGYSSNELSDNSPVKFVASFPPELALISRATSLIKGIAKKLDLPLSLAETWTDGCHLIVDASLEPALPLWSKRIVPHGSSLDDASSGETNSFRQIVSLLKDYAKVKGKRLAKRTVNKMPPKVKSQVLDYVVKRQRIRDAA